MSLARFRVTGEKGDADLLSLPCSMVGDGCGDVLSFCDTFGGVTSDGSGSYSLFKCFFLIFSGFSRSSKNIFGMRGNNAGLSILAEGFSGTLTILIDPFRFIVRCVVLFELNEDCFKWGNKDVAIVRNENAENGTVMGRQFSKTKKRSEGPRNCSTWEGKVYITSVSV